MKVLYLHQYFLTPEQGGAIRSYHLAKALIAAGHEVEVITSHNHPGYYFANVEGIKVHYLPVYYENSLSFFGRVFSFIKFMRKAYLKVGEIENIDVCYATSTPLSIGVIAIWIKIMHRIHYYFEVRDLWPEAPIQMGVVKNFFLKQYLFFIEKRIYKKADAIIALSPGIKEGIYDKVPDKECYMIPNFSDCDFFYPEEKKVEFEERYNVKGKFVISYFGAIGKSNHLDYLLDSALELSKRKIDNVHFIIAGRGSELPMIKEKVKSKKLTNISFVGFINKTSLHDMLNVTDATYISFAKKPILETNSPNKFFDGLAAGKLTISNTKGWMKELIEKNECGFYYDPEKPEDFIAKLIPYLENNNLLKLTQKNARKLAEEQFSKDKITKDFLTLFE